MKSHLSIWLFLLLASTLFSQTAEFEIDHNYQKLIRIEENGSAIVSFVNDSNTLFLERINPEGVVTRIDSFPFTNHNGEQLYLLNHAYNDSFAYLSFGTGFNTQVLYQYDYQNNVINWKHRFKVGSSYSSLFNVELMPFRDGIALISATASEDPSRWFQYDVFDLNGNRLQDSILLLENAESARLNRAFRVGNRIISFYQETEWIYEEDAEDKEIRKYSAKLINLNGDSLDAMKLDGPYNVLLDADSHILIQQGSLNQFEDQLKNLFLLTQDNGSLTATSELIDNLELLTTIKALKKYKDGFLALQIDKDIHDSTVIHLTYRNLDLSLNEHIICPKIKGEFQNYDFHILEKEGRTSAFIECISNKSYNSLAPQETVSKTIYATWSDTDQNNIFYQNLNVFPNPSEGVITIRGNISGDLEVYSSSGQLVLSQPKYCTQKVYDLSALPRGAYILKLTSHTKETLKMGKLILK